MENEKTVKVSKTAHKFLIMRKKTKGTSHAFTVDKAIEALIREEGQDKMKLEKALKEH